VIAGQREHQIAVVAVGEQAQEARPAEDVLARIVDVGELVRHHLVGHQLHQAAGLERRDHARVVVALALDDGADERDRDPVQLGGLADEGVVAVEALGRVVA
jgi:hypothetical protein